MKKTTSLFALFAFLGVSFLTSGTYAQEVIESGDIVITRSEPILIGDRETGEGYASIKEVYLSGDNEYVNLSEISTGDVCGEGYHLITLDEWDELGENLGISQVENECANELVNRDNISLTYAYTLKFGLSSNFDRLDAECVEKFIDLSYSHVLKPINENSAILGIYYDSTTNTFKNIIAGIEINSDTGDPELVRYSETIDSLAKDEPLICIGEEIPLLESEIKFINEDNGFEYETKVARGEKLPQEAVNYVQQNNEGYFWFYNVTRIDYIYDFLFHESDDIGNEEFKYDTVLHAYKPIDKEDIIYKGPYNIENRENNEIIATIKEISIQTDYEPNIYNVLSTDNICGTGFHLFTADRAYWENREYGDTSHMGNEISPLKMDLYMDKFNNYPEELIKYFPNYTNALGFLMLGNVNVGFTIGYPDIFWGYFKFMRQTSENSADIFNYFDPFTNLPMITTMSIETDTDEPEIVIGEDTIDLDENGNFLHGTDFLCIADEKFRVEPELVFINEDNDFEYRARAISGGKISPEDLEYINEENPNYIRYVADVLDIDIENEGFEYNTVVSARKPVEIKDTEKGEVVKLKSVQNSPYFADDFDEYEDEVTWFYDREDVCGQKYHIITGDELADLIISGNLSEDAYNWWGDNTLTYCVSDPYVIVTFKNEDSQSEYEIYVEKGNTLKSWDINKITKNNTGYEWYDGDVLINLTGTVFNNKVTLYAKKIKESDNNQSHSSGGGGGGGGSSKSDTDKKTETQTGSQNNSDVETQDNQKNTDTQTDGNISDKGGESQNNTQEGQQYSEEFQQAYKFAKGNGITTMPTIQDAKMNQKLTRIQMAKMLSQYAINVLGKTPDASKSIKFKDVTEKMNSDYDNGVSLAYQLGIMGINMKNNKFRPNDEVTRGEFATALSRLLYNTQDGTGKAKYYEPHIAKLLNEGIITNPDPRMKELRGYVMIMLMRSAN